MKKIIIILSLFISYSSYAQYVPKAGNKLNTKPNGILVPTSTTDDTPIARLELFNTGVSTIKSSALDIKTLGGLTLLGSGDYGILSSTYGGTGVNNGGRLLTYAGAVTFAGAFTNTITTTANTTVTFPTTGTLYGTATGSITSAQLLASLSNETGTGVAVFGTSPTIATPNLTYAISTKTAAYTVTLTDYTLIGDATTASFVITLPTAASASGKMYSFKKIDATANTVTIKGNGAELVDGTNTKIISTQYSGFTVQSNGTVWYIVL